MSNHHAARLLAGFVTLCPLAAGALDLTPDTTRNLADPSYLPLKGQLNTETIASYSWRDPVFVVNSVDREDLSGHTRNYMEQLTYGVTDRLSVRGSANYFDSSQHYTFRLSSIELDQKQFDNPTFSVIYRALEETHHPVSVDFKVDYTPAIVSNEPGAVGLSLFVNRETRAFTIQGEAGATHSASFYNNETLSGNANSISSEWDYFVGVRTRLRLSEQFALNSGIVYMDNLRRSVTSVGGVNYSVSGAGDVSPYVTLSYMPIPGKINIALEYDHKFIGDNTYTGTVNGTWTHQSENLIALHLQAVF